MVSFEALITFIVYLFFLMGIGIFFYYRTKNIEDYLLGGRRMGSWVTALSAQASDMSGWLLMGLPGAVYLSGLCEAWIAIGLFIGTVLNWILVAPRLRVYTEKTGALTIASFFEKRFKDPTGLLRIITAIITLFFFTIYSASGLVAAGKLFDTMFNINYYLAVSIGTVVIVVYTFLGGFLAVAWTDLFQGLLMFFAILVVPVIGFIKHVNVSDLTTLMQDKEISTSLFANGGGQFLGILAIVSTMAWGLGYFGQPHILSRFMSIRSLKKLKSSTAIAIVWVFISLAGAIFIGLIGIAIFPEISMLDGDSEKVFIFMIQKLFSPWIGGILLAAILSAIMSTIDSQLLVSSSTLTEDFYKHNINKNASEKELIWIGRICVLLISIVALLIALNKTSSVLGLVSYAWGGFGAAFGPVILMALFSKKTTWKSALAGLIVGTLVLVIWKQIGLSKYMYEIVPGFCANFLIMFIFNIFHKQEDEEVLKDFANVKTIVKSKK